MDREVIHLMRYFKLGQTIKCEENPIECNCTADEITITSMQGPKIVPTKKTIYRVLVSHYPIFTSTTIYSALTKI